MDVITKEQILQKQIKLLNLPGQTLSNFNSRDFEQKIFINPSAQCIQKIHQLHKLKNIRTTTQKPNNPFYILTYILLTIITEHPHQTDILQKIKCVLYSERTNLASIKGRPHAELDNNTLKKIVVEFLQVINYHVGNFEVILSRYPIILQIFSMFFRLILRTMNVEGVENYNYSLNVTEAITSVLDYFDIIYNVRKNLIVLECQNSVCIFIDQKNHECYLGERSVEVVNKIQFTLEIEQKQYEVSQGRKQSISMHGLTPTPCFNQVSWDDPLGLHYKNDEMHRINKSNHFQMQQIDQKQSTSSKVLEQSPKYQPIIHFDNQTDKGNINETPLFKNVNVGFPAPNFSFGIEQMIKQQRKAGMMNPQFNMKISDIKRTSQQMNEQKRQTLSQRANVRQRSITDQQSETFTKMSEHTNRHDNNKIQSNVLELKINPIQRQKNPKRFKTAITSFQQLKFVKKRQGKIGNYQSSKINGNKTFGKFPAFLAQKKSNNPNTSRNSKSPVSYISQLQPQKQKIQLNKKPKVNFTYSNCNISQRNSNTSSTYSSVCSPTYFQVATYKFEKLVTHQSNLSDRHTMQGLNNYSSIKNSSYVNYVTHRFPQSTYYFKK